MKFFKCAVLPALSAVITALLFLFLGALFLQKSNDPYSALRLLPVGATLGGAILCGLLSALFSKGRSYENPFFAGLLFAASLLPFAERRIQRAFDDLGALGSLSRSVAFDGRVFDERA
mgnify:CR=1 FL=1